MIDLLPRLEQWWGRVQLRFSDSEYETEVAGISAQFQVSTTKELLRAKNFVGERILIECILDGIDNSDVFWDIGANIGTHSCFVGQVAKKVYAFEPDQQTADRLSLNLNANAIGGEVHRVALYDEDKEVGFSSSRSTGQELGSGTMKINNQSNTYIKAVKGDTYAEEYGLLSPDVVKIDVEGSELNVLRGAKSRISNAKEVFIEIHDNDELSDITDILNQMGFSCSELTIRTGETHIYGSR